MAASMRCNKPRGGIRSISLPCRPHSSTYKMDQELNKLKTWEAEVSTNAPTAETICNGLSGLGELYRCTDDLLNLPLTQQALSALQHDDPFNELLDGSIRFLDILESDVEGIENGLESMFRHFIRTRASLLNIVSQ